MCYFTTTNRNQILKGKTQDTTDGPQLRKLKGKTQDTTDGPQLRKFKQH